MRGGGRNVAARRGAAAHVRFFVLSEKDERQGVSLPENNTFRNRNREVHAVSEQGVQAVTEMLIKQKRRCRRWAHCSPVFDYA